MAKVTDTAHGTIRSVEHTIQHLEDLATTLEQNITDTRKRLADTQVQVGTPFEYAERVASLAHRQLEIEDSLDLTKSQASRQVGAEPANAQTPAEDEDELKERYTVPMVE